MLESVEEFGTHHGPHATSVPSSAAGRPKFDIPQEQLQYLIDYGISMTKIAQALGVSKSTIKRRVREYGISVGPRVVLDDSELDILVRDIQREYPNAGYRRIHSQLKSRGVKVTQSRVRESMHDFVEPVRLCKMAVYLLQSENRKVHSDCNLLARSKRECLVSPGIRPCPPF